MDTTTEAPIDLPPGRAITLPHVPSHQLLVLEGRVWLTRSGEPDDHFLQAGDQVLLGGRARTVIEAEGGAARCRLVPLRPTSSPRAADRPARLRQAEPPVPRRQLAAQAFGQEVDQQA